jgi:hypothetical protein
LSESPIVVLYCSILLAFFAAKRDQIGAKKGNPNKTIVPIGEFAYSFDDQKGYEGLCVGVIEST